MALIEVPGCVEPEHNQEAERQTEQLNGQLCQGSCEFLFFFLHQNNVVLFPSRTLFLVMIKDCAFSGVHKAEVRETNAN